MSNKEAGDSRRWWQFSLRSLMLLVGVLGIVLGLLGKWVRDAREQAEVVRQLTAAGASVVYEHQKANAPGFRAWRSRMLSHFLSDNYAGNVIGVFFSSAVSPENLRPMRRLPCLDGVALADCQVDGPIAEELSHLTALRELSMHTCDISDEAVACKSLWNRIEYLTLVRATTAQEAAIAVRDSTCLRYVTIAGTTVTAESINEILAHRELTGLDLSVSVDDAVLLQMAPHDAIEGLNLASKKITDKGLACLKGFPNLRKLSLYGAVVTDAGVPALAACRKLIYINLQFTAVTEEGVLALKRALPDCRVEK